MKEILAAGLQRIEENGVIIYFQSVTGGDINDAYYIRTKEHEYFVKMNNEVDQDFFCL